MKDLRFSSPSDFASSNGKNPSPPEMVGPLGKVPSWKTIDFFMGGTDLTSSTNGRTNWRTICVDDMDFSRNPVSNNVLLIPDRTDLVVSGGMNLNQMSAEQAGGGPGGIMDIIKGAVEIFTGAMAVPEWGATTFQGLKELELPGDYKFDFKFGNAGLYNGFEEVVKPIMALTTFFGVEAGGGFAGHLKSGAASIRSPYPTEAQFLKERVMSGIASVKGTLKDGLFDGNEKGLAEQIAKVNSAVASAMAAGAYSVSTSKWYRNLYLSWGRFVIGPMTYQGLEYGFNMNELDTYGWPVSGYFKVNGLKSMRASTTQAMLSPIIKGV